MFFFYHNADFNLADTDNDAEYDNDGDDESDDVWDGWDDGKWGSSRQEHSTRFKGSSQRSHTRNTTDEDTVAQFKRMQYLYLQYPNKAAHLPQPRIWWHNMQYQYLQYQHM